MGAEVLVCALGFAVIFECLMPMISPAKWKQTLQTLLEVPDGVLQKVCAAGVVTGLAVIWIVQSGMFGD